LHFHFIDPRLVRIMEVQKSFFTTVSHPFHIEHVEEVKCNLCGSGEYTSIGKELEFDIRACSKCGLVYVSPQPAQEEFAKFYAGMYSEHSDESAATRSLGYVERHLAALLKRRRPQGGRIVEVGCGYGNFLAQIKEQPWRITALEVSQTALEYARARIPNAEFHQTTLEDADILPESHDCVAMIAVLEHVKNPRAAIAKVSGWLRPGGLLVIQVPYVNAFIRLKRFLPFLPIAFEAPRHLFDFSPKTLPAYLNEAGYRDIRVEIARPYSSPTPLGAYMIWGVKLIGLAIYFATFKRYVYPFAGGIVVHAVKT
jgi:SAM-dependent methyltransferase